MSQIAKKNEELDQLVLRKFSNETYAETSNRKRRKLGAYCSRVTMGSSSYSK